MGGGGGAKNKVCNNFRHQESGEPFTPYRRCRLTALHTWPLREGGGGEKGGVEGRERGGRERGEREGWRESGWGEREEREIGER